MDRAVRIWRERAGGGFAAVSLVLLCLAVYLPGLVGTAPIDRDESRFAQASRQMLESVTLPQDELDEDLHRGGLVVPRVAGRDRLNKPPLIYWLQGASAYVCSGGNPKNDAIWMYRVPSVLGALLAVLLTWRLGCAMFDPRVGWLGGAMLAVSPVVVFDAHQARADQVLLACMTGAVWALWHVVKRPGGWSWAIVLWVFVAAGVMTKGPITPMVVVLGALAYSWIRRDWRWLWATKPFVGLLVVAAAVGPWVYGVAQHVGFANYWAIISDEVFGRSGSAKEGHWGPPGYHLILLVVLFWPGSLLTGLAFGRAWRAGVLGPKGESADGGVLKRLVRRWRTRSPGSRALTFLVAIIVPSWIVFELVATKLPHYTLPLYPAVALLTARAVFAYDARGATRGQRIGFMIWMIVGIALAAGAATLAYASAGGTVAVMAAAIAAASIATIVRSWRDLLAGLTVRAQLRSIVAGGAIAVVLFGLVAPRAVTLSRDVWRAVELGGAERPLAMGGYHEDSMIFWSRGRMERIGVGEADEWLAQHPTGVLVIPLESAPDAMLIADVEGFNIGGGRNEHLVVIENRND